VVRRSSVADCLWVGRPHHQGGAQAEHSPRRCWFPARPVRPQPGQSHRRGCTTIRQCPATDNAGPAENQHMRPGAYAQPSPGPAHEPEAYDRPPQRGSKGAWRVGVLPCPPGPLTLCWLARRCRVGAAVRRHSAQAPTHHRRLAAHPPPGPRSDQRRPPAH
jgi:hypothetical protein